jgi:septum site-determining protein MinC
LEKAMGNKKFEIKGTSEGLLITINASDWKEGQKILFAEIENQTDFLSGAEVFIDVKTQIINALSMGKLIEQLDDKGLKLLGVLSDSYKTERSALSYGLRTTIEKRRATTNFQPQTQLRSAEKQKTVFLRQTLRSGAIVEATGDVTVLGDVNPGATIISAGNIVVWGKIRGNVHAGSEGNQDMVICALEFNSEQVRIAGKLIELPKKRKKIQPEMASIIDNKTVLQNWKSK